MKNTLATIIMLFTFLSNVNSQTVTSNTELQAAITNATPGGIITLANGGWKDTYLNLATIF